KSVALASDRRNRPTIRHRPYRRSILPNLLGRLFGSFFADFFFHLAAPFAGQPWPEKAVKEIGEKENRRHPLVEHRRENQEKADYEKTRNGIGRFPIDRFETGILEEAET